MNFIAVHKSGKDDGEVLYVNPQHITSISPLREDAGALVLLSNGTRLELTESADDLILKIRGFTKPRAAQTPEFGANPDRLSYD